MIESLKKGEIMSEKKFEGETSPDNSDKEELDKIYIGIEELKELTEEEKEEIKKRIKKFFDFIKKQEEEIKKESEGLSEEKRKLFEYLSEEKNPDLFSVIVKEEIEKYRKEVLEAVK